MKQLAIIGASGHGKVVADIARLIGYDDIVFLDDNEAVKSCGKYPVIGRAEPALIHDRDYFVAVGESDTRSRLMEAFGTERCVTLIHPNATIAEDVSIGLGTVVMAGTVINPGTRIGMGCIINTCSSVDHDCTIGDYCHISVGAHLSGSVIVGNKTWIAVGASVANNVAISSNCVIGAGAIVIRDVDDSGTYVGAPARKIR